MTFLLPLGLLLGLAVIFPIIAHALRKGRARSMPFPAAHLVPEKKSSARQRHQIEDKLLLFLRILIVACLALLAASPFVQCSRLSLSRTDGASVAAALIIDDSASMRARLPDGRSRLEAAIDGAHELLDTARPGDSFSIVLAGSPARILTPSTTELGGVRDALSLITASDRKTDLTTALHLARALQADLPQRDRPLVLFSDVSSPADLDLSDVIVPQAGLQAKLENCALVNAIRGMEAVQVEIACTSAEAVRNRSVQLKNASGESIGTSVQAQDGAIRLELPQSIKDNTTFTAQLTRPKETQLDQIEEDDQCVVLENQTALSVALRADQGKAGMKTGAGTVLQAAIEALNRDVRVHPVSLLPDRAEDLDTHGALLIDDPSGFTPEISDALGTWTKNGGVALLFLGPGISQAPLGSTFAPFLLGSAKWERTDAKGVQPKTAGALGPLTTTWADIDARFRAAWAAEEKVQVKAQWDDGRPFIIERAIGRGLLLTVSLPASVDRSDLALRPAFLELMDYAISQSAIRRGAQATAVGERWSVGDDAVVRSPQGNVLEKQSREIEGVEPATPSAELLYVEPGLAGRYSISYPGRETKKSFRVAIRDAAEQVSQPNQGTLAAGSKKQHSALTRVGISREIALLALILSALELAFRAWRRARSGRPLQTAVS